jgi:FemAB-related protein (PEP-CTERM system-associated)
MNAYVGLTGARVFEADLRDIEQCRRIDHFVQGHVGSTPFHLTAWSRAVERGTGARAHYLVAESSSGVLAVLPCHEIHSRLFGSALVSAGFAVGGGILGGWPGLAGHMLSLAIQKNCPVAEVRGGPVPPGGWDVDDSSYHGFAKALADSDAAQLAALPRKRRADIRKALAAGLTIRTGRTTADVGDHYRVYAESVRNLGSPVFPRALFRRMLDEFGAMADIVSVYQAGRPIASVLSFYHQNTAYPYWGGGTRAARHCGANELLYYALMCHARSAHGCDYFDFGRSKAGTGAAAFKKNFGFQPVPLVYARRPVRGRAIRVVNPLHPRYRIYTRLWRHMPLPLANFLGPMISRGLG